MSEWKPDIFEYMDYRDFLRAYYDAAKANVPAFSYRYFARKAGFATSNFLQLVIKGQRNLGPDSIWRFAKVMKLTAEESRFFQNLVDFCQGRNAEERNIAFEALAASRRFRQAGQLDTALYRYTAHWYVPAIRELAAREDFKDDPKWVAKQLLPPIKPKEAKDALDTLYELGFLERKTDGAVVRRDVTLTSGHRVQQLAVTNYYHEMIEKAGQSIEGVAGTLRELGAVTVCISPERVQELKQKLREIRVNLLDFCERDPAPTLVYQLNFQLFPLSTHNPDNENVDKNAQ